MTSYLLRWQRRATPFGLFSGVTTASVGPATAQIGAGHRALARADAEWLTMLIDHLERHPDLRPRLTVVADNAGIVRDRRFIVATRAALGARTPGPLREISVRHSRPIQSVLTAAASPIRFGVLAAQLNARFPAAAPETIRALLHRLIDQGILITSLRPPMTAVDGLTHLIGALHAADAQQLPEVAALLRRLEVINESAGDGTDWSSSWRWSRRRSCPARPRMRRSGTGSSTLRSTSWSRSEPGAVSEVAATWLRIPTPCAVRSRRSTPRTLTPLTPPTGTANSPSCTTTPRS
ncbi:lantibiotic dehydratase [Sphaerimonospora sp. CA-214678]|uniref:lantibiotic dehydratase n=1 Tax=Sphaerimonospora sp. CA-214678 TaxID=3240029 RepID=UPI003D91D525